MQPFGLVLFLLEACSATDAKTGAERGSTKTDPSTELGARSALMMPLQQVQHSIGSFQWRADSSLSAQAGTDHRNLTETFLLETDGQGRIHGRHDNSKEYGYEFYWAKGTYTYKLRYRPFRRRQADWEDVSSEATRVWNTISDTWAIIGRFAHLESTPTDRKDRIAYRIALAENPRHTSSHGRRDWATTMNVSALSGRLVFDRATGVPMFVHIEATYGFSKDGTPAQVTLHLKATLTKEPKAFRIQIPKAQAAPIRRRPQEDRRALLGPTPRPGWYRAGGPIRWWRSHSAGRRVQQRTRRLGRHQRNRGHPLRRAHPRHAASPRP